jgi:tetratricopeptide (TPR) repeat protein
VPEPEGNDVEGHAGLQKVHRGGMADRVWRDALFGQARAVRDCTDHRQIETLCDVPARHRASAAVRQQGRLSLYGGVQAQPTTDLAHGRLPQRHRALLASLAMQMHASAGLEDNVGDANADDLGDPCPGVIQQREQEMVALGCPTCAGLPEDREHLFMRKEVAADLTTSDINKRIRQLRDAAVASQKAGKSAQAQEYSDLIREAGRAAVDAEHEVLEAERKLAEESSNDKAVIGLLERMLELNPADTDARFALAYQYGDLEMDNLAAFHYSKIPSIGRSTGAWNNLGVALGRLDLPIGSIAAFREAESQGETLAMSNIAGKLIEAGFLPEAKKTLKDALAIEDHHKNVDSGLASAKGAVESEKEKETKIFDSAKPVRDFLRAFGRAFAQPMSKDISGRWNSQSYGVINLARADRSLTGSGSYDIPALGALSSILGGGLGTASPPVRYVVEYQGTLFGGAVIGTVSRHREGAIPTATLLGGGESKPRECLMWVSDSGDMISVLEQSGGTSPNSYMLKRA